MKYRLQFKVQIKLDDIRSVEVCAKFQWSRSLFSRHPLEWFLIGCRETKTKPITYKPINQSICQPISSRGKTKTKTKVLNCLIIFDTQFKTALI